MKILFFSRGRGYGHAIPDLAIADDLAVLARDISIQFVSYSSGAQVLRNCGRDVIDLELPENNPFLATLSRAKKVIGDVTPDIVVAHEEFSALYAANVAGLPSVFIGAWLPPSGSIAAESLSYCDSIIIVGNPGLFPLPVNVRVCPRYVGPIIRKMKYAAADRLRIRAEMGISDREHVTLVVPGGASNEQQAPILDIVLSAFFALKKDTKRLYWLSGKDSDSVREKTAGLVGVEILTFYEPIERLIVASDIVLTKGTRGITLDAASLGVPSISLSHGTNPVDELIVSRINSNIALNAKAVNGALLAQFIENAVPIPLCNQYMPMAAKSEQGAGLAAKTLLEEILRLTSRPPG